MKYLISENKLDNLIYNYIVDIFMNNEEGELNFTYDYDEDGNETDDAIQFYFGDYGDDYEAFRWYSEEYFDDGCERCPIVELSGKLKDNLNSMFSDKWESQFKKWMNNEFNIYVKTIQ